MRQDARRRPPESCGERLDGAEFVEAGADDSAERALAFDQQHAIFRYAGDALDEMNSRDRCSI